MNARAEFWSYFKIRVLPLLAKDVDHKDSIAVALGLAEDNLGRNDPHAVRLAELYGQCVAAGIKNWMN